MCLRNYLWCYVGRSSVEEDPGEDLACYGMKGDYSVVPMVCSFIFLVYDYNTGILPLFWYITHLPGFVD